MWGVNAMEIPGMSLGAQTILMGEHGSGFTEKFTSAKSFCKWCNLVPNNKISGGKLLSSKVPKQKNRVGQVFRLCANSVKSVKTGLGIYFRRQKSKGGHLQAIVATANKYEHKKNEDYAIGSIVSGYMHFVCKEALLFLCRNTYFFLAAFSSFAGAAGL